MEDEHLLRTFHSISKKSIDARHAPNAFSNLVPPSHATDVRLHNTAGGVHIASDPSSPAYLVHTFYLRVRLRPDCIPQYITIMFPDYDADAGADWIILTFQGLIPPVQPVIDFFTSIGNTVSSLVKCPGRLIAVLFRPIVWLLAFVFQPIGSFIFAVASAMAKTMILGIMASMCVYLTAIAWAMFVGLAMYMALFVIRVAIEVINTACMAAFGFELIDTQWLDATFFPGITPWYERDKSPTTVIREDKDLLVLEEGKDLGEDEQEILEAELPPRAWE